MDDDVLIHFRLVGQPAKQFRQDAARALRKPRDHAKFIVLTHLARQRRATANPQPAQSDPARKVSSASQ